MGKCPAVVERDLSRKVAWTSSDDFLAVLVAGSISDECYPVRTLKGRIYVYLPRAIEDLVSGHSRSLTAVDANMLKRVRIKQRGALSNGRSRFEHLL
jgi:hypothetical protein